jgi:hypothetical protein
MSWMTLADNPRDKARSRDQPVEIDRPVVQAPIKRRRQHALRANSHCIGAQEFSCAFRQLAFRSRVSSL